MPQVVVNLRSRVQNSAIRYEKRNGKDVIVVPSATLPDNIVMNRILYPSSTIEQGYRTLDRKPAPMGHPMVNGQYVSAYEPEAINSYWVGAWNENVRRENGRVFLDKIIDVDTASKTEKGKQLLDAINKQEPISTSTGLMLTLSEAQHADYDYVAETMEADHDAILIGEAPAASTQQGVGIFVNSKGERTQMDVQNADVEIDDDMLESLAESLAWRIEYEAQEEKRKPLIEKIMQKLRSVLDGLKTTEGDALTVEPEDEGEAMTEAEQAAFDALKQQVETLAANAVTADKLTEALKPVTEAVTTLAANAKANEEAQKSALVDKVVKANILDEESAKELSVNALQKLADKIVAAPAAGIFGAFNAGTNANDLSDELPGGDE